ncbi:MAG: flagellar basal body L-ring protein FlgH [Planctomycetota bacterium]
MAGKMRTGQKGEEMRGGQWLVIGAVIVFSGAPLRLAWAQNSSLFSGGGPRTRAGREDIAAPDGAGASRSGRRQSPLTLKDSSWTYRAMPPPREIQKHDIVSVRVDVLSRMESDGELRRRKNAQYDARLKDWILLDGLRSMRPSPQTEGEPRARGELKSDYRSQGELETSESLAFNLACEVVDIRPNGNLVLEGRSSVIINEERWSYIMTGICRPDAIGPDNVVLSRDIINLDIRKGETGSVAAGYQRGWFQKLFDMMQPF